MINKEKENPKRVLRSFIFFLFPLTIFFVEGALSCEDMDLKKDGIDFIVKNMPVFDHGKIPLSRIEEEINTALSVRYKFPWAGSVPWGIYKNDVLPYAVADESRDTWREDLEQIMSPLVRNCKTGREAALIIASNIGKTVGVKYSIEREKPNQSAKESMKSGLASCSGQSILLVNALRSVGIPARLAGVLLWSHIQGNHTWVEVWCDGSWEMIEWGEKDFYTPWVLENIGMLNISKNDHKIIASTWSRGETCFPLIWKYEREGNRLIAPSPEELIPGVDVTDRYMSRAKKWYDKNPVQHNTQRLYVDCKKVASSGKELRKPVEVLLKTRKGVELGRGVTPSLEKDVRQFLKLFIPSDTVCFLEWKCDDGRIAQKEVKSTNAPVQIISLEEISES